jgi:hypothetical protein
MDHVPGGQTIPVCQLGLAGRTAAEMLAFIEQLWPCCSMNGAIDPSTTKQRMICGINDRINAQFGIRPTTVLPADGVATFLSVL